MYALDYKPFYFYFTYTGKHRVLECLPKSIRILRVCHPCLQQYLNLIIFVYP